MVILMDSIMGQLMATLKAPNCLHCPSQVNIVLCTLRAQLSYIVCIVPHSCSFTPALFLAPTTCSHFHSFPQKHPLLQNHVENITCDLCFIKGVFGNWQCLQDTSQKNFWLRYCCVSELELFRNRFDVM